jgi:hypothetical protein
MFITFDTNYIISRIVEYFIKIFLSPKKYVKENKKIFEEFIIVTTLELGLQPKQGLAKVQAKNEAQESHFMFLGAWESVRE